MEKWTKIWRILSVRSQTWRRIADNEWRDYFESKMGVRKIAWIRNSKNTRGKVEKILMEYGEVNNLITQYSLISYRLPNQNDNICGLNNKIRKCHNSICFPQWNPKTKSIWCSNIVNLTIVTLSAIFKKQWSTSIMSINTQMINSNCQQKAKRIKKHFSHVFRKN